MKSPYLDGFSSLHHPVEPSWGGLCPTSAFAHSRAGSLPQERWSLWAASRGCDLPAGLIGDEILPLIHMGMDQYLLIPFLDIFRRINIHKSQLFWCSPTRGTRFWHTARWQDDHNHHNPRTIPIYKLFEATRVQRNDIGISMALKALKPYEIIKMYCGKKH